MDPNFPPLRDESFLRIDQPLRLLRNRVVLRKLYRDASATLWTPPERLPMAGIVLAVGPPEMNEKTGFVWPNYVRVGQRIIVSPHEGVEITWYGEPALIVREDEVLAVFEDGPVTEWCRKMAEQDDDLAGEKRSASSVGGSSA